MTTERATKKAPAEAGARRDIVDGHDRAWEAQQVATLYATLLAELLPGLYGRQRALALDYLAPVASVVEDIQRGDMLMAERKQLRDSLTPSQRAAMELLEISDALLAAGVPDTDYKRAWVRRMQDQALLAHGRLHASSIQRDTARQEGTRRERRPDVTAWIDEQLRRTPDAKSPALWECAPDWITDQIGKRRFATRVTEARKKRASK